jgi:peptidoglycan/xylan/chitin deacetylase (PgdA/CDA1 family)
MAPCSGFPQVTLKSLLKIGAGRVAQSKLVRPIAAKSAFRSVNVVYYHYVGRPDPHYQAFYSGCTLSKFEDDIRHLKSLFDFASIDEVVAHPSRADAPERPLLAITFDDGFDLGAAGLLEVLERHAIRATTFVITSCIGNRSMMWRHKLSAIRSLVTEDVWRRECAKLSDQAGIPAPQPRMDLMEASKCWDMGRKDEWAALLWEQCGLPAIDEYLQKWRPYFSLDGLRQWLLAGHNVGFHTHTHPFCSRLTRDDLDDEFIRPALRLKTDLGLELLPVSYPFGDRLASNLEENLASTGIFSAFFGIRGFTRRSHLPSVALERANLEGSSVGWAVFVPHVFKA